jgi:hypothetical protein
MNLSIPKCAIIAAHNKIKMTPKTFKAYIQSHKINYKNNPILELHQNEPYKYLGIQLIPSLKWNLQRQITIDKLIKQSKQLLNSPTTFRQKNKNSKHNPKTRSRIQLPQSPLLNTRYKKTRQSHNIHYQSNMQTPKKHPQPNNTTTKDSHDRGITFWTY